MGRPSRGGAVLVALLLAGGGRVAAQEPADTAAADTTAADTARVDSVAVEARPDTAAPAFAYTPPGFALSLTFGTVGFGDELQRQTMAVDTLSDTGEVLGSGRVSRAVRADGGLRAALTAVVGLAPGWAARLTLGTTRGTLDTGYESEEDGFVEAVQAVTEEETGSAELRIVSLESALRYRVPSARRAQPYIELGVAAMRWEVDRPVAGAPGLEDGLTRFAAIGGVGARIPVSDRVAGRIQLSLAAARTPADPEPAGTAGPGSATVASRLVEPDGRFGDGHTELTGTMRFELGVSVRLAP